MKIKSPGNTKIKAYSPHLEPRLMVETPWTKAYNVGINVLSLWRQILAFDCSSATQLSKLLFHERSSFLSMHFSFVRITHCLYCSARFQPRGDLVIHYSLLSWIFSVICQSYKVTKHNCRKHNLQLSHLRRFWHFLFSFFKYACAVIQRG